MKCGRIHKIVCVNNEEYTAIFDSITIIGGKQFLYMINYDDTVFYLNLDNVVSIEQTEV
jgi:hypothetical protein